MFVLFDVVLSASHFCLCNVERLRYMLCLLAVVGSASVSSTVRERNHYRHQSVCGRNIYTLCGNIPAIFQCTESFVLQSQTQEAGTEQSCQACHCVSRNIVQLSSYKQLYRQLVRSNIDLFRPQQFLSFDVGSFQTQFWPKNTKD